MRYNPKRNLWIYCGALVFIGTLPVAAKTTTITFSHVWGPTFPVHKGLVTAIAEFEKRNPNIKVKMLTLMDEKKLFTTMAGGVAPDVALVEERISNLALRSIVNPIDDLVKKSGIKDSNYWKPSWQECFWAGKMYAMPFGSDANFAMAYNKGVFKESGLPDRTPKTISELELFAQKTTKIQDGRVRRVGIVPAWNFYGLSNTVYTWGWVFGGSFYNDKERKVTANDPRIIKSLEWVKDFTTRLGGVAALNQVNDFGGGKSVMVPLGSWDIPPLRKAGRFELGFGKMPVNDGVNEDPTWIGGHKIIIPSGSKHRNEAWEFIKWVTSDPVGTELMAGQADYFPSYKKSPVYDKFKKDKELGIYAKILETADHCRPIMPAAQVLMDQLATTLDQVMSGKKEPSAALGETTIQTQKALDRILARFKSR